MSRRNENSSWEMLPQVAGEMGLVRACARGHGKVAA
jgi:hypothetical protein